MSTDQFRFGKSRVRIVKGDITEVVADVIVNAANSTLLGGGGVDGAIHRKGGPQILEECRRIRKTQYPQGLPTGKAVITSGGDLKAQKVVHTVGPVWQGGKRGEPALLAQAYIASLNLVIKNGFKSVAFPSISTGAYGYPIEQASKIALSSIKAFLQTEDHLDEVIFTLFSEADFQVYKRTLDKVLREK